MDLQYRLPPFQQVFFNREILISLALIGVAVVVVAYFRRKAAQEKQRRKRREDLQLARKILTKRGGSDDDFMKVERVFDSHPRIDLSKAVMVKDSFRSVLFPVLEETYSREFAERVEKLYFPPPKDTRAIAKEKNLQKLVETTKSAAQIQAGAAMIDLMDATLKPGLAVKMAFENVDVACECLVMSHNMQCLNITLPPNPVRLVGSIVPGVTAEGHFESGPSLLAFTSTVLGVTGGSMPFCRLSVWKSAWEVRKRDSIRLPISLDIDFQHISTTAAAITMAHLEREMGSIHPGRLVDLSLGGGGIETPSRDDFNIGDFLRFSAPLIPDHPPATLLGAIVDIRAVADDRGGDAERRVGIQFLALDDVSQRLLARAMRQLQEIATKDEWLQAQRMLEQMRRNNIQDQAEPERAEAGRSGNSRIRTRAGTTIVRQRTSDTGHVPPAAGGGKPPPRPAGSDKTRA